MSDRELLERTYVNTLRILQGESIVMSQIDDATAATDALSTALDTIIGDDASVLAELKTLQGQTAPDLSGIITKLQTAGAKATAEIANLQAALPAATAPAASAPADTSATATPGVDPGTSTASAS